MSEKIRLGYERIIRGSRKLLKGKEYTIIYDPRLINYPENHQFFHELSPKCADIGDTWIMVPTNIVKEAEAILDTYPEEVLAE